MSDTSWGVSPRLIDYLRDINPTESPILADIRAETARHRKGKMAIAPEQALWLVWLARLLNAEAYLEIGVFTGYSSTAMALAMPEHGRITACDINVTYTNIAQYFWQQAGMAHKIDLHLQPAILTLNELIANGFSNHYDMALIDADKWPTVAYFERCLNLVRPGGVIAIDNVLLHGRVSLSALPNQIESASITAMDAFNRSLRQDSRIHVLTLPIGDGLTLVQKKHD
ncbi:class I SAM-dependent methyltransferase [Snodgrassella sp. CFCC 13594]|uniref:class I SAM-dependent methyltransferase n=1 Tax=Snodgrassella sp. CFCC 13594 TaxID=1775559 RepID=UPI00083511FD|nr:class I SAM-dependent methyltransferase [Snodgrassella sp. CFCC 13594]